MIYMTAIAANSLIAMQSVGQSKPRVTDGRMSTDDRKELMFTQNEPTALKKKPDSPQANQRLTQMYS
ncbi:MAG: hypothetical protein GY821_09810 [Gammaproteobacteria bacterium]|nr:hypothetical protein [Gammaproteobacteria bacterium]